MTLVSDSVEAVIESVKLNPNWLLTAEVPASQWLLTKCHPILTTVKDCHQGLSSDFEQWKSVKRGEDLLEVKIVSSLD